MNADKRARVAYLAGSVIGNQNIRVLYDRSREKNLKGEENLLFQHIFKHGPERNCTVKRDPQGTNFCVLTEAGQHLCFSVHGRLFDGYDHQTHSHFSGHVLDNTVSLFDYSASDYFCYRF